jgi:hypothetical protein
MQAVLDIMDAYLEAAGADEAEEAEGENAAPPSAIAENEAERVTEEVAARDAEIKANVEATDAAATATDASVNDAACATAADATAAAAAAAATAAAAIALEESARRHAEVEEARVRRMAEDEQRRTEAAHNTDLTRRVSAAEVASRDLLCVLTALSRRANAAQGRVDALHQLACTLSGGGGGGGGGGGSGSDDDDDEGLNCTRGAAVVTSTTTTAARAPSPEEQSGALRLVLEFLDNGGDLVYGDDVYTRTPVLMKAFSDYCRRRKLQGFNPPEETMQAAFRQRGLRQVKVLAAHRTLEQLHTHRRTTDARTFTRTFTRTDAPRTHGRTHALVQKHIMPSTLCPHTSDKHTQTHAH